MKKIRFVLMFIILSPCLYCQINNDLIIGHIEKMSENSENEYSDYSDYSEYSDYSD